MYSGIYLYGPVLWVFMTLLIIIVVSIIGIAIHCIVIHSKYLRLQKRNRYLRKQLSIAQEELYRNGFKLPEVDDNAGMQ